MSKNIFFTIIGTLVVASAAWAYISFGLLGRQKTDLDAELQDLNQRFDELAEVSETYDEFKLSFNQQMAEFDTLRQIIPSNDTYSASLERIRSAAENNRLEIIALQPKLIDVYPAIYANMTLMKSHIECYIVDMKVYGDYLTIAKFLDDVQDLEMEVNLARIKMESEMEEGGTLLCEIQLYTYIYIEIA